MPRELRVHGVSGTPPRDMLYTDPVTEDVPSDYTRIYARPPTAECYETEAFHWGGLTSGSRLTALWILLVPFVFANVAGWMSRSRGPFNRAVVRLAGLCITGLFVAQSVTAVVLLPYSWLERTESIDLWLFDVTITAGFLDVAAIVLFGAVAGLFASIAVGISTQSHFAPFDFGERIRLMFEPSESGIVSAAGRPEKCAKAPSLVDRWHDPAGPETTMTSPVMWSPHPLVHRLRRLHFAFGWSVISLGVGFWVGSSSMQLVMAALLVYLAALTAATVADLEWASSLIRPLTLLAPHTAALALTGTLIWLGFSGNAQPDAIHSLSIGIAIPLGVFGGLSLFAGPLALGALVIGIQLGSAFGIAVAVVLEELLGVGEVVRDNGGDWVAVAMLFLLGLLLIVACLLSLGGNELPDEGKALALGRRVELESRRLFQAAAIYGLVVGAFALIRIVGTGLDPTLFEAPSRDGPVYLAAGWLTLVTVALLWWRLSVGFGWMRGLAVPVVAAVLWVAASNELLTLEFLGVTFNMSQDLVSIATFLTILIPGVFMLASIWRGFRSGERSRRSVGILWDLGSFWPRWFHPLAAPAYGPIAVTDLSCELEADPRDVLGAHSQGSMIALVALQQLHLGQERGPEGLITYGSQMGILYPRMFPSAGIDDLVASVSERLEGRWVNLWRPSDPIGGHQVEVLDTANWYTSGQGHSRYEETPEYCVARWHALAGSAAEPPINEELSRCPEDPCPEAPGRGGWSDD